MRRPLTTACGSSTTSPHRGLGHGRAGRQHGDHRADAGYLYYHARMVATNSADTTFGTDIIFTTLAPPIVVTRSAAPGVTVATLNGSVNPKGKATTYHFEYGATTSYGMSTALVSAGSAAQAVSAVAVGLTRGTTYHYPHRGQQRRRHRQGGATPASGRSTR